MSPGKGEQAGTEALAIHTEVEIPFVFSSMLFPPGEMEVDRRKGRFAFDPRQAAFFTA
jgi:hypothetical protein